MDRKSPTPRWLLAVALLLTLLVAAGLRLYRLPELPVGLHYDEAANGILASEIARGAETPVFIPSYTGKEVLFFYWAALWMKLLGATPLALRLSAALAGVATVAATAWAVGELLHWRRDAKWVAVLSTAFVATSFWHLILSRYGFRAVTQPLLQALTVAALWRGLRPPIPSPASRGQGERERRRRRPWLLLAGFLCGLTAYTYLAARAFPVPLAAALMALVVADRENRRVRGGQTALFVAVAAVVLAPLAGYWLTHAGSFMNRTRQVAAASWAEAWSGIRACLGMFFLKGDPYIRFNLPLRPMFGTVTAGLFLVGIGVVIAEGIAQICKSANRKSANQEPASPAEKTPASWRVRDSGSSIQQPVSSPGEKTPASWRVRDSGSSIQQPVSSPLRLASCIFLLTLLPIMLLPSALAVGEITPSNLRAVGLLPFVYVFPALGLSVLVSRLLQLATGNWRLAVGYRSLVIGRFALIIVLLAAFAVPTAVAYFRDWSPSAALYYETDGDLADVADYLNQTDLSGVTPYVASVHYRHPTLALLAKEYAEIRWLRGGQTLVFPAEGEGLLILPRSESKDLDWVRSVLPESALAAAPPGPDGEPGFHAFRVGPAESAPPPSYPLKANLGGAVQALGYDVVGEPRAGERAKVAVWWKVLQRPEQEDYNPLVRLTDPWGFAWGEKHHFHYPSEQWTPGEIVVDHLWVQTDPGAPPGEYGVQFSLYSAEADARLPVLDAEDRYAGTALEMPIQLARAAEPANPDELEIRTRLDAHVDGLVLLGTNLDTSSARPGERVYVTLFWQAKEVPLADIEVQLSLGDVLLYGGMPVHGTYPSSEWTAGEVIVDRHDPRLPLDAPPGDHPLRLCLMDAATGEPQTQPLELGEVTVEATARTFDVPPITHLLTATLGGQVELLGYDLAPEAATAGDTLTLTLYWRALSEMEEDYTVFAHLLAPDGSVTGQRDSQPVGGSYQTNLWLPGEVVADLHEIPIPADAPAGAHALEVGMYVAESGFRLAVEGNVDDAIPLQAVSVASP